MTAGLSTSVATFTPAPWAVELEPGTARIYSPDDACIADLSPDFDNLEDEEEIAANAHLIAAAPDLLAACRLIVECSKYWANAFSGERRALEAARIAIAKAERHG